MTTATLRFDIVSGEEAIFSREAAMVFVTGEMGELGIAPGHAPLLTSVKAGSIRVLLPDQSEEIFYVRGGLLEVQSFIVTVLADTVVRAHDIDEAAALEAKARAEQILSEKTTEIDFARATAELSEAIAQIRAVQRLKKGLK